MIETTEAEGVRTATSVFLADDDLIVREGVRALLALEPDLDIVGVADEVPAGRRAGTGVGP